jgi:hypothetical protein
MIALNTSQFRGGLVNEATVYVTERIFHEKEEQEVTKLSRFSRN